MSRVFDIIRTLCLVVLLSLYWACGSEGSDVSTEGESADTSDEVDASQWAPDGRDDLETVSEEVVEEVAEEPEVIGDTYANFAAAFFSNYCTSCHSSSGSVPHIDLSLYAVVVEEQETIRCGVSGIQLEDCSSRPGTYAPRFPIGSGPRPDEPERERLVGWIDHGLPE